MNDTAAIRETVAAYERHQNDPEEFLALHAPEAAVVNIVGRRVLGRDHMEVAMRAALATPLAQVRTTLDIEDIRFVAPNVAIVSLIKTVHDEREDAEGQVPLTGSLTLVFVAVDGDWRVALSQTTPRQ